MIARYLGLTVSAEQALADAFVLVGFRHATEPEMRNAARLHSNWCHGHIEALRQPAERYRAPRCRDGERLRRGLFHGGRMGGFGLLRDTHDLLTLATSVHGCWMALLQAACEARDRELEAVSRSCDAETIRQMSWLQTRLRLAAGQTLTVPAATRYEFAAAIPSRQQIGAIADLMPAPTRRGLAPLAPLASIALIVATLGLIASRGHLLGKGG